MKLHYCKHCRENGIEKHFRITKDGPSIWLLKHLIRHHPNSNFSKEFVERTHPNHAYIDIEVE